MASPLSYGLIFQCALWVDPKIYDFIRLNVKKNHENDYYTDIVVLKTEMIMRNLNGLKLNSLADNEGAKGAKIKWVPTFPFFLPPLSK